MRDIVFDNVSLSFDEKQVFQHFNYTFKGGEITCVVGGSGKGKTSLLNLIAGLCQPSEGTVTGVPEKISFVFQENRLCENYNAVNNLKLVTDMPREEMVDHLAQLGLGDELDPPVKSFSGGMKRRVAIARAVCYNADCVLLDEPFKGLDPVTKKMVIDYLVKRTVGKTVIIVTHDRDEVEALGKNLLEI